MIISFSPPMAHKLAEFLTKKFAQRVVSHGHTYTIRQFAEEIGIKPGTLRRMMDERVEVKGMELDHLAALIRAFGREFTDEFDLTPKF